MSSDGEITARIAEHLGSWLRPQGYDVFHDHGGSGANVGKIVSSVGKGLLPSRITELGQLDILVTKHDSRQALVLVEIEETNDRPKNLLGDALGTLLGDSITFKKREFHVGSRTTLIIVGKGGHSHDARNKHLARNLKACRSRLSSANKAVGKVVLESQGSGRDMEGRLMEVITESLGMVTGSISGSR